MTERQRVRNEIRDRLRKVLEIMPGVKDSFEFIRQNKHKPYPGPYSGVVVRYGHDKFLYHVYSNCDGLITFEFAEPPRGPWSHQYTMEEMEEVIRLMERVLHNKTPAGIACIEKLKAKEKE